MQMTFATLMQPASDEPDSMYGLRRARFVSRLTG